LQVQVKDSPRSEEKMDFFALGNLQAGESWKVPFERQQEAQSIGAAGKYSVFSWIPE